MKISTIYKLLYSVKNRNLKLDRSAVIEGAIQVDKVGRIEIGAGTRIRKWSCFKPYGGSISIGKNCTVNSFCHFSGNGGIEIGDNVMIATQCVLVSANHNFSRTDVPIREQGETRAKITIEDDVWLGAGVKVLAGVTLHKGAVIGAGAVVTADIPEYAVAVGVPAKVLYDRRGRE